MLIEWAILFFEIVVWLEGVLLLGILATMYLRNRYYRNRVWCCCRNNDLVGYVPWDVLNRQVHKATKWTREAIREIYPIYGYTQPIPSSEVIVFRKREVSESQLRQLTDGLCVVKAIFALHERTTSLEDAYLRMQGHPLQGNNAGIK